MAITTSPDNLPSPTSGDPYNYVVDVAALADGTQDALTQKANMGVGTSTQRTAALSKFPDGALWYDTTTSSEWRRVAGAWVDLDSGAPVGVNYRSGYENFTASFPATVVIRNRIAYLSGLVAPTTGSFSLSTAYTVADIWSLYRPLANVFAGAMTTAGQTGAAVVVATSGTIEVRIYEGSTAPGFVGLGGVSWPVG